MKVQRIKSVSHIVALALLAACSESEMEEPSDIVREGSSPSESDPIEEFRVRVSEFRANQAGSREQEMLMAQLEDCESSLEVRGRIQESEERLNQLLLNFSEQHPSVVSARRELEELVQAALEDCVERIQGQ